jgi:ribosomal-protein-alanine N-acetyltransferase
MQNLLVRDCRREDLSAILKIEKESFPDLWGRELLKKELSLSFSRFIVAEVDGEIVGYLIAWIIGDSCELNRIAVAPCIRKKGIGKKLLYELIDYCKSRNVKEIFLEVRESNLNAIKLYRSSGFERISIRKNYYGGESAFIYRLKLDRGGENAQG